MCYVEAIKLLLWILSASDCCQRIIMNFADFAPIYDELMFKPFIRLNNNQFEIIISMHSIVNIQCKHMTDRRITFRIQSMRRIHSHFMLLSLKFNQRINTVAVKFSFDMKAELCTHIN